jgi:signal transduction histidine kinase
MAISVDGVVSRLRKVNGEDLIANESHQDFLYTGYDSLGRLKEVTGGGIPDGNGAAVERQFVLFEDVDPEYLKQNNAGLTAIHQVAVQIHRRRSPGVVAQSVLQILEQTLGFERSAVLLADRNTGRLRPLALSQTGYGATFSEANKTFIESHDLRLDSGVVGAVLRGGKSIRTGNVSETFPQWQAPPESRSVLGVPISVEGIAIGLIYLESEQSNQFNVQDQQVLEVVASQLAMALQNAHLFSRVRDEKKPKKGADIAQVVVLDPEANDALLKAEARSRAMVKELRAQNEELNAFNHTVAHDLKNPLSILLGFAEVLFQDYKGGKDEVLEQGIRVILENGRRLENIINELLLLAEVRELDEITVDPLDMASIVVETRRRLSNLISEYQAEIVVPAAWPVAVGHRQWVEEIWVNYLSNAIKYGGRPPKVELGAMVLSNGMVRYWVRDNGPGISPEDQKRLFVPFTKLKQVNTKGHGLGLSIVQRIAAKLGGQVGVESKVGAGSLFWFTLPIAE